MDAAGHAAYVVLRQAAVVVLETGAGDNGWPLDTRKYSVMPVGVILGILCILCIPRLQPKFHHVLVTRRFVRG